MATAESSLDTDGYAVVVGELGNHSIESSGTFTFDQVPVGEHVVELQGLQDNCTTPSSPLTVTVVAGGTAQVSFDVTCWPPPSGRIAFTAAWDGHPASNQEIHIVRTDGTEQINLTNNSAVDQTPAWSPDGSRVAFSSNRDGDFGVYVMSTDGSDTEWLADGDGPAWSPDGSKIAYNLDGDIYLMDSDGTNTVNLTSSGFAEGIPAGAWSPDGEKIVYLTDRHNNWDVFLMDADGSNHMRLTTSQHNQMGGSWSPDGTKIAYWEKCNLEGDCVYYMNADGTGAVRLTGIDDDRMICADMYAVWSHGS